MKAMSYLLKKQVLLNEVSAMFEKPCQHFLKCLAIDRGQAGSTKTPSKSDSGAMADRVLNVRARPDVGIYVNILIMNYSLVHRYNIIAASNVGGL